MDAAGILAKMNLSYSLLQRMSNSWRNTAN